MHTIYKAVPNTKQLEAITCALSRAGVCPDKIKDDRDKFIEDYLETQLEEVVSEFAELVRSAHD